MVCQSKLKSHVQTMRPRRIIQSYTNDIGYERMYSTRLLVAKTGVRVTSFN